MIKIIAQLVISISLVCVLPAVMAQPASNSSENTADIRIQDLSWIDQNYLERGKKKIQALSLAHTGAPIRGDLSDLDTLQQLLEKNVIAKDDYQAQQAMGIVLGNVMLADFPTTLKWKVYEDSLGRSRALCVKETHHCLFPVTMLSRRIELGIKPDVNKIYNDAIGLMEQYLPQLPYGGGIYHRLPRR